MTAVQRQKQNKSILNIFRNLDPQKMWEYCVEDCSCCFIGDERWVLFHTKDAQRLLYRMTGAWYRKEELKHALRSLRYDQYYKIGVIKNSHLDT